MKAEKIGKEILELETQKKILHYLSLDRERKQREYGTRAREGIELERESKRGIKRFLQILVVKKSVK